ncbi:protein kinase family protein [Pseudonocardia sp. KRD291]|uniref:protein kinase family protein n=1 Tax=Pseudonocardia sp. KRD291 TaxID=2792007 RepID=UPI001C4A5C88|nr:protein kinase family protein [Pseudonocardia sp. KRD291]MBW0104598.1 protein kinase family protein [Pseudonocardia sp. KRD291]
MPEQARPTERIPAARDVVGTTSGSTLTDRYRLLQRVGSDLGAGAEFWRAEDTVLRRPVAITVLRRLPVDDRSDDPEGAARAGDMVVRALRSGCFEHAGSARLLDVLAPGSHGLPDDVLGAAVAEWVPGRSLSEVVAAGPVRALRAARILEPLAAAAMEAHQQGLVLGCDHPQRVRITPDGRAQLAFLLPRPSLTAADDVRGLGAVLYTLLTRRWPLSVADAARAELVSAERTPSGALRSASALRPGVPLELDTLCTGALGQSEGLGRVHTAAAVHRLLTEVLAEDEEAALFPPVHDGAPAEPDDVWQDEDRVADTRRDPVRRRNLMIGLSVLAVCVLLVLGYLGVQLGSLFGAGGGPAPIVVNAPPVAAQAPAAVGTAPAAQSPVTNVAVGVFDPTGDGDNADDVSAVTDGNPATSWKTQQYLQPFPALKPGVGVMASFVSAEQLSQLRIDSPSAGSVIEVRSAPTADTEFSETIPVTTVTLQQGETVVPLTDSQPTQHLLLWITKLGGGGTTNVTQLDDVTFDRAVR